MTREEAIKMLKSKMDGNTDTSYEWAETVRMAIKALEQEPILDKIRTEIIELRSKQNVGVLECLDIIDKYKAGSEE